MAELPENPQFDQNEQPNLFFKVFGYLQQKLAVLKLTDGQKSAMSAKLTEEFKADSAYWIEIFLSSIIASLGLLQNSVAIVIGAMLISPLFRPIELTAFGVITGQSSNIMRGIRILFLSILMAIGLGYLTASIVPLQVETAEILARTTPNLLDLFIALASAVVVFLALSSTRFSESVAGVAMSAALIPPLAVAGIELAFQNYSQFNGSLFLFFTNLVAIIFVGIVMFFLYGFAPHQRFKQLSALKNVIILLFLIGVITIPLVASLQRISTQIGLELKAKTYLENVLAEKIPDATLSELNLLSFTKDTAALDGTIRIPQGSEFYLETKNSITKELGEELKRNVDLQIDIVPVASIVSEEQQAQVSPSDQIATQFRDFLRNNLAKVTVVRLDVADVTAVDDSTRTWAIKPIITLPAGESFTSEQQSQIKTDFQTQLALKDTVNILWTIIPQYTETETTLTAAETYHQDLVIKFDNFFDQNLGADANVQNFNLAWQNNSTNQEFDSSNIKEYTITFDLYLPAEQQEQLPEFEAKLQAFTNNLLNHKGTIKMRVFPFNTRTFEVSNIPVTTRF